MSLKTAQQTYKPGDTILITAGLDNNNAQTINIILECLLTSERKKSPEIMIPKLVTLGPYESSTITLFEINVTQDVPSDKYRAVVNLILNGTSAEEREVTFLVQDTLKEMGFSVHLCADVDCDHEPAVFIKGKDVYVSYDSPIYEIQVEGDIYFPDKSVEHVIVPTVLQTVETGSDVLGVTASKEAYKSETREINFAIIEKEAAIVKEVQIDIKPGSDPNGIYLNSKGVVPVAILTTENFDAGTVAPESVSFAGASPVRWTVKNVDDDGDMDLLFHFKTQDLNLDQNSTEATLSGLTRDGLIIGGTDTVKIVPKPE